MKFILFCVTLDLSDNLIDDASDLLIVKNLILSILVSHDKHFCQI